MYTRHPPDDRFYRGIRIPSNYHGNAFSEDVQNESEEKETLENSDAKEIETEDELEASMSVSAEETKEASLPFGGLFGKGGGIGFEELLIIAIAFLVSQSSDKDDLAFLLLLLLFIK